MGNDNSLTQTGCHEKLTINFSVSQISREFKATRLTRKRIEKRSNVRLTDKIKEQCQISCSQILDLKNRQIHFLEPDSMTNIPPNQ